MSPRVPRETGKTTSLNAVAHRVERGRFARDRSRDTQAPESPSKLQPVEHQREPRSQLHWSPCPRRATPSSCTSPRLRGSSRYMPVRVHAACQDHAQMHASAAAGLRAVPATSIAHNESARAPCHQPCCTRAAAAPLVATPKGELQPNHCSVRDEIWASAT